MGPSTISFLSFRQIFHWTMIMGEMVAVLWSTCHSNTKTSQTTKTKTKEAYSPKQSRKCNWTVPIAGICSPSVFLTQWSCCDHSNLHLVHPICALEEPNGSVVAQGTEAWAGSYPEEASVMSLHVISGLVRQQLHTKIGNRAHSICNLSGIYNIPVNHWNFKNTQENHEHCKVLPLTNWQPWQPFHPSFFALSFVQPIFTLL